MNHAILSGNLGRDPDYRTHDGDGVLSFPLAVQVGNKTNPQTMWVDCVLWGKRATSLQQYLFKGARVAVGGAIKLEEYQAKDGTKKTRLRLSVDQIDLPPKQDQLTDTKSEAEIPKPPRTMAPAAGLADLNDDIPF